MTEERLSLEAIRRDIDSTDAELVELLKRRAALVLEVKRAKQHGNIDIYSPERERQILDRVKGLAAGGSFPQPALERIFGSIISATRSLIGELAVSYSGPENGIGYEAALAQFGENANYSAEPDIADVFAKVERGDCHYGVVPIRTGDQALASKTLDVLMQSNLTIIAEIEVKERFALIGAGPLHEVRAVFAEPYAFGRTLAWLKSTVPFAELVVTESSALAARRAAEGQGGAFVAPERAAEGYGMRTLASAIEEKLGGDPRYVVIGTKMPEVTGKDKTSLACAVTDRAGALRDVLRPLSERGITLLRIESQSMRNRAWEYVFFIDLTGHSREERVALAIAELQSLTSYLKVFGSYPLVCPS